MRRENVARASNEINDVNNIKNNVRYDEYAKKPIPASDLRQKLIISKSVY